MIAYVMGSYRRWDRERSPINQRKVHSCLYDEEYYLTHNIYFEEFKKGRDNAVYYKLRDILKHCDFTFNKSVLDIWCGRGEMVYYAAKARCKKAISIDYGRLAIKISNQFKESLQEGLQQRMHYYCKNIAVFDAGKRFYYIFVIEVWKHVYASQIDKLLSKVRRYLKDGAVIIITTPNGFCVELLSPAKRIVNIPFNLIKFPARIISETLKSKSVGDVLGHIFQAFVFHDSFGAATNVNVPRPPKIIHCRGGKDFRTCGCMPRDSEQVLTLRSLGGIDEK